MIRWSSLEKSGLQTDKKTVCNTVMTVGCQRLKARSHTGWQSVESQHIKAVQTLWSICTGLTPLMPDKACLNPYDSRQLTGWKHLKAWILTLESFGVAPRHPEFPQCHTMQHHHSRLHHRRPQTVGGFKKCFEEQGQTHEIAATGIVKIFAISAGNHFTFSLFVFACFVATLDAEKRWRKHPMGGARVFGSKHSNQAA